MRRRRKKKVIQEEEAKEKERRNFIAVSFVGQDLRVDTTRESDSILLRLRTPPASPDGMGYAGEDIRLLVNGEQANQIGAKLISAKLGNLV